MLSRTAFQRVCALHLPLLAAISSVASAQPSLCQLQGELLTPHAWCTPSDSTESNSLGQRSAELLTPADWIEALTPCSGDHGEALLEPFERCVPEPELVTPLEWARFEGAGLHVR